MTDKRASPITPKTAIIGLLLFCYSGFNLYPWYSTGNFYASHNGELAINYHDHPGYFAFLAALNIVAFESIRETRMTTMQVSSPFEHELKMFGTEEESAQQYFFGFLALQLIPSKNPDVLRQMRETSTFWIATRYALLMSTFVALGRIFDQDKKSLHNIDKLLTAALNEIGTLSKAGLESRRIMQGMDPQQAAAYVADKYDLTVGDVRDMRKAVRKWRKVYEERYRKIRHEIFAHKSLSRAEADELMAKTSIEGVKELLGFLHSLYISLWQLHVNGIAPDITPATFDLPPMPGGAKAGERMYRESADLLYGLIDP